MELINEVVLPITKKEVSIEIESEYHYDFFILIEHLYRSITVKFNIKKNEKEYRMPKDNTESMVCDVLRALLSDKRIIKQRKMISLNQYNLYLLKQSLEKEKEKLEFIVEELESTSYSRQSFLVLCNVLSKINEKLNEYELNKEILEFLQLSNANKWMLFWDLKKMKYNEKKNVLLRLERI